MYYNKDNYAIYYEKHGHGDQTIIILPGWGDTRKTFDFLINKLKNDYTIYIMDYPGFGNTPFPNRNLTMDDYSLLVIDFLSQLNITNPIVIAHSFGGRIAILLSSKYNISIKNLILIDSAGIKPKVTLKKKFKLKIYKII